jgi:hypothetical protein
MDLVGVSQAALAAAHDALPRGWTNDLSEAISNFEWPKVDLPKVAVGKAVSGAAVAAHIRPRRKRSRWPLLGGLIVVGVAGWALLGNRVLRAKLASGARQLGGRVMALRSNGHDRLEIDPDHPVAFPAAQTAPIHQSLSAESSTVEPTPYPAGLGSNDGNGTGTPRETVSPV